MLPADAYGCLQWLVRIGRYGNNPTEVAKYLLTRGIDDLTRAAVLPNTAIAPEEAEDA